MLIILAKTQEDKIKGNLTTCKRTFQACKKYEDSSIAYVSKCKTSSSNLKSILSALYFAKNKLNAVKSKASTISGSKSSSAKSRMRRAALNSSTEVITSITSFVARCQVVDVDDIGTDETIFSLKTKITKTNVLSFTYTSTQIITASSSVTSLKTIITMVNNISGYSFLTIQLQF